jgi:hypothetical protein
MAYRTYNPAAVSVVFGTKLLSGYADDSFVAIERMTDTWMDQVGTDGYVSRSKSNDTRGTITVTLTQTSPSNDDLQAMATADELTGNAAAPVLVRDASGRTICSGDSAWVTKPPANEFGRNVTNRQWVLRVANLVIFTGGSDQAA